MAPPLPRSLYRLVELIAFLKGVSLCVGVAFALDSAEPAKSVLVPYGERGDLPAVEVVEENLREVFHSSRSPRIELFSEYLDFARVSGDQQVKALLRYLQERYAGRRIDPVVPVAGSELEFALTHREELFPGVPMVFCAMDQRELEQLALPALKKAGLPEERVPVAAEMRLRPAGFWETNRVFILAAFAAVLLQTILIVGLISQRHSRRKAEASLRQSEERLSLVADSVNLGIEAWDTAKDEVWMTERGRALFGFDRDASLNSASVVARVHPDDRAVRDALIQRAIQTHGEYSTEYRVILPDGRIRWIGARGRSLNSGNGKATQLLGISVDVTAQKDVENKLRLVVEGSLNGIVLINGHGRIDLVNTATEMLFGYWREELIGQPIEILVPERFRESHPIFRSDFVAASKAPVMGAGRELFGRRKDGTEFPVEIGISRIHGEKGVLALAVIVDVSARKKAEAESHQYREELAHLSRIELVAEMATAFAHELNQPLSGIMNNASAGRRFIAKGRADMPKLDHLLEAVVMDARRSGEIIRNIRVMVRKGEGARIPMKVNSIITEVVQLLHSEALERHCTVESKLDPDLPAVSANPVLIQQVLLNIMINALDAMRQTPAAERRVIISSRPHADHKVWIGVRDFGTGLPKENPDRIFDPFFSTKQDGLGMGLSIARSIISSHGGELAAENAEGGGAWVHFSLPATGENAV